MNSHVSVTAPVAMPDAPAAPAIDASAARRKREKRRRRRRRVVLLVVVLVAAGGGYAAWRYYFQPEATATVQYLTATVTTGAIEDAVSAVGTLSASQSRTVEAPLAGRIATLAVAVGAVVAEGDVIATLETDDLQSAVTLAEAQLANLQASLADRQSQLDLAQQNVTRQEGLLAANAVAEATVQQARASVISANASLESVRTQLVQQQQTLDTARANLAAATVRAPIAGTIVDLPSQVGQSVAAGTALMTIADLATMTVTAQVSEADIGRLDTGMSAYFTTLAGSTRRWTGTLREILPTPTIENNVVMYSILFDVGNSDGTLMIGMSTEAFFVVAGAQNVLRVPVAALQQVRTRPAGAAGAAPVAATGAAGAPAGTVPAGIGAATATGATAEAAGGRRAIAEGAATTEANAAAGAGAPAAAATTPAGETPEAAAAAAGPVQLPPGFDPANLPAGVDPAQIAARIAARQAGGGGQFGGAGAGGGNFGGRFAGANGAAATATAGGPATPTTYTVRVMLDDGTIEDRSIEVGVRDRVNAEVLSGLTAGERVVTGTATPGAATGAAAAGGGAANAGQAALRGAVAGGGGGIPGGNAVFIGGPGF